MNSTRAFAAQSNHCLSVPNVAIATQPMLQVLTKPTLVGTTVFLQKNAFAPLAEYCGLAVAEGSAIGRAVSSPRFPTSAMNS